MAALCDALVLVTALWALGRARSLELTALVWRAGLALVVAAAAVGTARYAAAPALAALHGTLSTVAANVGMPLVAAGLLARFSPASRAGHRGSFLGRVLAGVAFTAVALTVGDTGEWHGMLRENVFHVLFAASLVCFGAAYEVARQQPARTGDSGSRAS